MISSAQAKPDRNKHVPVIAYIFLSLFVLCAMYVFALIRKPYFASLAPLTIQQVKQLVRLNFPSNTLLLDAEKGGELSPYVIAKLQVPRSKIHEFLAQPPIYSRFAHNSLIDRNAITKMKARGWRPDSARRVISVDGISMTALSNAADGLWIIVDLDDTKSAIVYLYYQN